MLKIYSTPPYLFYHSLIFHKLHCYWTHHHTNIVNTPTRLSNLHPTLSYSYSKSSHWKMVEGCRENFYSTILRYIRLKVIAIWNLKWVLLKKVFLLNNWVFSDSVTYSSRYEKCSYLLIHFDFSSLLSSKLGTRNRSH